MQGKQQKTPVVHQTTGVFYFIKRSTFKMIFGYPEQMSQAAQIQEIEKLFEIFNFLKISVISP